MGLPPARNRVAVAAAIGIATGTLCWLFLSRFDQGAGDFGWAIRAARDLAAGANPYDRPMQLYPLPAALCGLPLAWLRPEIAGGLFYGISSGLLAFGGTRLSYDGLLIFLAYPYWAGLMAVQWQPLIMAGAFFPFLLCAGLAKPQLGLPIALTNLRKSGVVGCALVFAASLLVLPQWPWLWISHLGAYQHFVPALVAPGALVLLALFRCRERDARLLLLAAFMPQRWFYDQFILWLIPKTRRELVWTVFLSWGPGIWRWFYFPHSFNEIGRMAVFFFYLPMLAVILLRDRSR